MACMKLIDRWICYFSIELFLVITHCSSITLGTQFMNFSNASCTVDSDFIKLKELTYSKEHFLGFTCSVDSNASWDFTEFFSFLSHAKHEDGFEDKIFALRLKCHGKGTTVILPSVIGQYNLTYLSVQNCYVIDDRKEEDDILGVIEFIGGNVTSRPETFVDIYRNANADNLTSPDVCPTQRVERVVYNGTSIGWHNFAEWSANATRRDNIDFSKGYIVSVRTYCKYTHLRNMYFCIKTPLYGGPTRLRFSQFPNLEFYSSRGCGLKTFPDFFQTWSSESLYSLKVVDLSHNFINDFTLTDHNKYTGTGTTAINLTYNNFTTLTQRDLDQLSKLNYKVWVDLRNNPMICDCDIMSLINSFQSNAEFLQPTTGIYAYLRNMTCSEPARLKGMYISDLEEPDVCPKVEQLADKGPFRAALISATVIFIVLILAFVLTTIYRKEIWVLIFTKFKIVLPWASRDYDDSKKYDAFISYSSDDLAWVQHKFLPMVDNTEDKFKLCLHHRDFVPGKAIAENISDAIESSRHTILVLTRSFLRSEWCLFEFRSAFHQGILEKRRHIILVLLEDITKDDMEADLRACLKMYTYLNSNDYLFREKIIYALSDKRRIGTARDNACADNHGQHNDGEINAAVPAYNNEAIDPGDGIRLV